ncbi:uncharacterized protein Dvir_GJ26555 [Drosophila virilis]|uniref:Uncharacterized protein n=1 Tax=Drosophila virilis TaxID=7244 RepID=A0A0Q9W274_DROVI|nr:uncharacterized protein LOC26531325 [Drosophila virilis]KRF78918.1 uncharacterized protein Dvir_GJ26555 [Drosophila virilis]
MIYRSHSGPGNTADPTILSSLNLETYPKQATSKFIVKFYLQNVYWSSSEGAFAQHDPGLRLAMWIFEQPVRYQRELLKSTASLLLFGHGPMHEEGTSLIVNSNN